MRNFQLHRHEDISGISGTGIVAEGVEFTNGKCVISWLTETSSIAIYNNIKELNLIHSHDGRTQFVWI